MLAALENLVVLNISYNQLSGELPNTPFFTNFPTNDITGNQGVHIAVGNGKRATVHPRSAFKLAKSLVISVSAVVLLVFAAYLLVRAHISMRRHIDDNRWEMMVFQKLDFSIEDLVHQLTSSNVIGTGSSGVVYKVSISNGAPLAVKKMWSSVSSCEAFESEIQTLGSIRHKNIVRLLGWCANQNMKLLLYDFLSNGSLSSLLHGDNNKKEGADWETRYEIGLGVGHALAYLHHDCVPAIVHGDVKAVNVLLGPDFEPYLADFGLARLVGDEPRPQLAGSYGYMAPEQASAQGITEKSDVYSFGVVLLQVLTGRHPLDPTLPGGANLVQWARDHLQMNKDPSHILDTKLHRKPECQLHEMLQTLAVSLLCISAQVDHHPTMKDVVAMLKEIRSPLSVSDQDHQHLCKVDTSTSTTAQTMVWRPSPCNSSNCSYAFSDYSVGIKSYIGP